MLQDYFQPAFHTVDFNALATGGDIATTVVDNSADFSNSVLKWSKLTIRPIWDAQDIETTTLQLRTLMMMVKKQDQDDSTVYDIDNAETVRELRNSKKILRGPWWVTPPSRADAGFVPAIAAHMKAIVLKNFIMDREEDLVVTFTNVSKAFAATS